MLNGMKGFGFFNLKVWEEEKEKSQQKKLIRSDPSDTSVELLGDVQGYTYEDHVCVLILQSQKSFNENEFILMLICFWLKT